MTATEEVTCNKINSVDIDDIILMAIEKVQALKENDICRYIPSDEKDGYIHHFTMQKMRKERPAKLAALIHEHIMTPDNPKEVPPRQRAARGSKKNAGFLFTKSDISRIVGVLQDAGEHDLIHKLVPKDPKTVKKQLIQAIKNDEVQQPLWDAFCQQVTEKSGVSPEDFLFRPTT